jgi:hypothetical protein
LTVGYPTGIISVQTKEKANDGEILIMDKNSIQSLLVAFLLGVLLTLLLTSRPTQGPYIPFGAPGEQKILDTRDGRVYVHGLADGKEMWHVFVQGFYRK